MAAFLSFLKGSRSNNSSPMPRYAHASAQVGNKAIVYSGRTKEYSKRSRQRLASVVEVFDSYREVWEEKQTKGDMPIPGVDSAACAMIGDGFFMFGGWDEHNDVIHSLHRLDTMTYHWTALSPHGTQGRPMAKAAAGMVACGDNLVLLGGCGIPHGVIQPGSTFTHLAGSSGLTNEIHICHVKEGQWSSPTVTGERPPPCFAFSLTSIDHRRAVMFGGDTGHPCNRVNDVYIFDLQNMHITKLNKSNGGPWPEERSNHAACCLNYGHPYPQLLVTGGLSSQGMALEDMWILDVVSGRWRQVSVTLQARYAHSTTACYLGPRLTEVTMFGGTPKPFSGNEDKQPKLADTTLLQFRFSRENWSLCDVIECTELGDSEERLKEKVEASSQKGMGLSEERLRTKFETLMSPTQRGLNEHYPVRSSTVALTGVGLFEERLRKKLEEVHNLGVEPSDNNEIAPSQKSISYEIDLADLEFGELLGLGGFGAVFRGRWKSKGFDVALKKVNINPDESDVKVMRELGEHPNIISFFGFAYRRPETIIVIALAKKGSLFDYLHIRKEKPTEKQSLTWARQISYGMAFMHRLDYIHRDLKSSNVLFSDDMVAQVSDFGTARFLKSSTVSSKTTGTHRWMAPELAQDYVINKKCDVFSYALVVWELMEHDIPYPEAPTDIMASLAILSGERPPISPNWPKYLSSLTKACWAPAPNDRPTFSDIVTSLENKAYFRR